MTQEQVLSGLKKDVRSLLVSAKNGLSPEQLKRDYCSMLGHPLPLRTLGFRNVMDMVKEMPDVVTVGYATDGSMVLKVVGDQTTRGIEQLVSRQRNPKPKATARKQVFGSSFLRYSHTAPLQLPRRGHAPPALPAQLRSQLRQLLSQGPVGLSELEPCFARLFGRPLQVTHYGFYSVAEVLAAAADLVEIKQSRTGSLLSLKIPKKPPVQAVSPSLSPTPSTTSAGKAPVDAGGKNTLGSSRKNNPNLPPKLGPRGTPKVGSPLGEASAPAPKPALEEKAFQNCVKKLEEELRNGILESGASGTVSSELKEQLCQVVAQNSAGISIHDFPGEFKRVIGADLPVVQCGFLSVTEMVSALSDVLHLEPGPEKEANSWIVKGNQKERREDNSLVSAEASKSVNASSGYYFDSGDSPWEGRGKREEPSNVPEMDIELRVTTKTFSQVVDAFPAVPLPLGGVPPVPPDALREERLRAPTRRRERELASVLVERVESPSHFYVRFHQTQEARALENMMIEMRACYTCPEVAERYRLPERYVRPGQVCCVAPRGMWFYRVVVRRVLVRGQVEVYYVDFGDLSLTDASSLRFLKSCYSGLPAQAVPSSLTKVRPVSGSWSPGATAFFQKLCCERPLVAAIHSYQDGILHLFLCDTHTEEDVYVHTALQDEGHALPCTTFYCRMIFGEFNPVALYMETGLHEERTSLCSLDSAENSPAKLQTQPGSRLTGPSPGGGVKLQPIREEVDLPDLPELEVINIPEVNSPAQTEKLNPFGALLCKSPEVCSDWDRGWTPGAASEETANLEDAAGPCPGREEESVEETSSVAGLAETAPQAVTPPLQQASDQSESGGRISETPPVRTPDCSGGTSRLGVQHPNSSYLLPWLRHTSPTLLGPAAQLASGIHLLNCKKLSSLQGQIMPAVGLKDSQYESKLCCERPLVAAIHSYQDGVLHLFLCDTHTEEDVYVHTALQDAGHALACTTFYCRMIFGEFNPVVLYMETGLHEERTSLCSLDSAENSPAKLQTQLGSPLTGPSPGGGVKLQPIREEVDLPDLPELEVINIPEVNSPAQTEKLNPFGALLCKSPEVFSDWDRGWTPGAASEETAGPEDAAGPCPGREEESVGETPSEAGLVETAPQAATPPPQQASDQSESGGRISETAPVRTPDCSGGTSRLGVQHPNSSYLLPWLRHTSPTLLGPAAQLASGIHLLNWYPYKMA